MKREEVIEISGKHFGVGHAEAALTLFEFAFNEVERRTIEKCAQVADSADKYNRYISREIATGIRALQQDLMSKV